MKYYIFCNIALRESKINILHPISTEIDKIKILSMSFVLVICLTFLVNGREITEMLSWA